MEEFYSIGSLFESAVRSNFNENNFLSTKFYIKICEIVPPALKDSVKKVFLKDDKLFIALDSAVSKHAFRLTMNPIIKVLNDFQNEVHIKEIVLI